MTPRLRRATEADRETVLGWRNDPWIVSLSATQSPVTREEHERWFGDVLGSPDRALWIIDDDTGVGLGIVRVDRATAREAFVTIYLQRAYTGRGIGRAALASACRQAFDAWPDLTALRAVIRADNEVSRRAFAHAGFVLVSGSARHDGCVEMVFVKPAEEAA
jgi:RimJ/RimL family protein N-acetyltransferase